MTLKDGHSVAIANRSGIALVLSASIFVFLLSSGGYLAAQDKPPVTTQNDTPDPNAKKTDAPSASKNMNIDMQLTYGQYNNMLSTISLSQETDNFVYLLNSNFKRSNDYGYNNTTYFNSSYYENKIGFSGNLNVSDGWKTLFEGTVDNDSHGMFDNSVYTREEKEKYSLSTKSTVHQTSSMEWYTLINYAGYNHRLVAIDNANNENSNLNKLTGGFGGEYIMSAANRIKWDGTVVWYDYSQKATRNDLYASGEILDDFKLTTAFGMSLGVNFAENRDDTGFSMFPKVSGHTIPVAILGGLSFAGTSNFAASVQYRYDLEPFKPENLYFDQKYVYPQYSLAPSRTHTVEGKMDIKGGDYLTLKGNVTFRHSDHFYNYVSDSSNVLGAHGIRATSVVSNVDGKLKIAESGFEFDMSYEYSYFRAPEKITYTPSHVVNETFLYNGNKLKLEWGNKFVSKAYTRPDSDKTIRSAVIGLFGVQYQLVNGLFSYLRVENLYNSRYYLREGYPEPGVTVLGGLRILL
jgi:hypothetical protein